YHLIGRREMISTPKTGEQIIEALKIGCLSMINFNNTKKARNHMEDKYEKLFDLSPIGIFILDMRGVIRFCNPAAYNEGGYSEKDFIGKHFSEVIAIHSVDLAKYYKIFKSLIKGEAPKPFEFNYIRRDGTIGCAEVYISLLDIKDGKPGVLVYKIDITERKRAEAALRESEEKYRDLLDNTDEIIQSVTPDGRFRYVNKAWRKALGYSDEQISNLKVFQIIHPDYLEHCQILFQRIMSGEDVGKVELALVSKKGGTIIVEGDVNCEFIDGKPVYTRGIFRDITKRKKIEEQVFRLSSVVSLSTDYIVITDFDAKIIDVNSQTVKMYGADSKEELIGRHFLELIAPAQRVMVNMDVREIVERGYLECREYNIISKNGREIPVQMNSSLVKTADGEPLGMVRVGREVSKQN
ncbi:PAS domain S-box protein, partial [Chloroflexota bacterium]